MNHKLFFLCTKAQPRRHKMESLKKTLLGRLQDPESNHTVMFQCDFPLLLHGWNGQDIGSIFPLLVTAQFANLRS